MLFRSADGLAVQSVNGTYGMDPQRMHALLMDFAATALGVDLDGGTR